MNNSDKWWSAIWWILLMANESSVALESWRWREAPKATVTWYKASLVPRLPFRLRLFFVGVRGEPGNEANPRQWSDLQAMQLWSWECRALHSELLFSWHGWRTNPTYPNIYVYAPWHHARLAEPAIDIWDVMLRLIYLWLSWPSTCSTITEFL